MAVFAESTTEPYSMPCNPFAMNLNGNNVLNEQHQLGPTLIAILTSLDC